jgi:hypothetical protein
MGEMDLTVDHFLSVVQFVAWNSFVVSLISMQVVYSEYHEAHCIAGQNMNQQRQPCGTKCAKSRSITGGSQHLMPLWLQVTVESVTALWIKLMLPR